MAYEALFNLKLKSLTLLAPSGEKQKPVGSIILFGVVNNSRSPQAYLTGILPISQPEEGTPSPRSGLTRNEPRMNLEGDDVKSERESLSLAHIFLPISRKPGWKGTGSHRLPQESTKQRVPGMLSHCGR